MNRRGNKSRWRALAVVVLVTITVSGCRSAYILRGDFEADPPGRAPNPNLNEGGTNPSGDSYAYMGGGSAPIVLRDNRFSPSRVSSWTRFERVGGVDQTMTFLSEPYAPVRFPTTWAFWTGQVIRDAAGASLSIAYQNRADREACRLTLTGGNFMFDGRAIGTYTVGENQTVIFTVNDTALTCNVLIFQGATRYTGSTTYSIALPTTQRKLVFAYTNAGDSASYAVDSVAITREDPEME